MATTMTTPLATIHRDPPRRGAWHMRLLQRIGRWATRLRRWSGFVAQARQRTEAELGALSDAMLHDIGIERWQIPAIARDLAASPATRPGRQQASVTDMAAARPTDPADRPLPQPPHAEAA